MYLQRHIEAKVRNISETFPVLLLTGPRQVGKTTLLKHLAEPGRTYVTLDDPEARRLAVESPALFLQRYKPPVLIDEIQYAPGLFPYIKMDVDDDRVNGRFWITGSQVFRLMKNVGESLAGRVGIVSLLGLSQAELDGAPAGQPFKVDPDVFVERLRIHPAYTLSDAYSRIFRGSMPAMCFQKGIDRESFYSSYVQTYVERDVREIVNIGDALEFHRFLGSVAARTAQELNYDDISKDLGISSVTVKKWISVLVTSGLVYLMQPYFNNLHKRLIKRPKLYFTDTGLCAYLTRWTSPETLEAGAMSGAIFENHVVVEILKSFYNAGREPALCFYRDREKREIDVLLFHDDKVVPIEIKKGAGPHRSDVRSFDLLDGTPFKVAPGGIVCLCRDYMPIDESNWLIPVSVI